MEEDLITQLPSLTAAMAAGLLPMAASPLSLCTLSHVMPHTHVLSSHFALNFGCLLIGKDGSSSSINGCTWVAPLINGWCNCQVLVLQIVNGCCCTLNDNTPNNKNL